MLIYKIHLCIEIRADLNSTLKILDEVPVYAGEEVKIWITACYFLIFDVKSKFTPNCPIIVLNLTVVNRLIGNIFWIKFSMIYWPWKWN